MKHAILGALVASAFATPTAHAGFLGSAATFEYYVDGSAYDTTARGPVPNPNKSAPPPPGPGLWQIHGVAKVGAPFNLLSLASVKGPTHQRMQLTARGDGQSLVVSETSGCRRTARLSRS